MRKKLAIFICATLVVVSNAYATQNLMLDVESKSLVNLPDFSPIYDLVGKSVVNVSVNLVQATNQLTGDPTLDFFFHGMIPPGQRRVQKSQALGSGFIISSDGYILTNAHVVANASSILIKLNDKREFNAKVVGIDEATDVAVLKIDVGNLPAVKIGNPNLLKPGKWVLAIGSPFGLTSTITQGIVSALSRDLSEENYIPYIQTDVPINPGNSGGPLINLNGEVVGINSQIYSKSGGYMGISFSIPIDYAMKIANQIKVSGRVKRGRLGISIQPVTMELANSFSLPNTKGALVSGVELNSSAAKAGIVAGDVILGVNDQDIKEFNQVPRIINLLGPNKAVKLNIFRNGENITINAVTYEDKIDNNDTHMAMPSNQKLKQIDAIGIIVRELNKNQLPSGIKYGLVVEEIRNNDRFTGLTLGDLIIGIGNKSLNNYNDFITIINNAKVNSVLALKILRTNGVDFWTTFIPLQVNTPTPNRYKR